MKNIISNSEGTSEKSIIQKMIKDSTPEKKRGSRRKKITESDIRQRAQKIYDARVRNGIPGDAFSDWAQAKDELKGKHT